MIITDKIVYITPISIWLVVNKRILINKDKDKRRAMNVREER